MNNRSVVWDTYFCTESYGCFAGCGAIISRDLPNWDRSHVVAKWCGGGDNIENLRPCCIYCNRSSQTEHLFHFMKRCGFTPSVSDALFEQYKSQIIHVIDILEPRAIRTQVFKAAQLPVGIISAATGCGKTSLAIEAVGQYLNDKILLWMTEMNIVIGSQFTRKNILTWKANKILPADTVILFNSHLKLCKEFPTTCIIACTHATARLHYQKVSNDPRFLGFVVDECHDMLEGDVTHEFLRELVPLSKIRIGLTATPKYTNKCGAIFCPDYDGRKLIDVDSFPPRMLLEYSIFEALRDGYIRWPRVEISRVNGGSVFTCDGPALLARLINIIMRSSTRKGIIWCDGIIESKFVHDLIKKTIQNMGIKISIDNSRNGPPHDQEFRETASNIIIIACERYRTGVDIRGLSFGIICGNERKGITTIIQCLGRLTRREPFDAIFADLMIVESTASYRASVLNLLVDSYGKMSKYCEVVMKSHAGRIDFAYTIGNHDIISTIISFNFISDLELCELKFTTDELLTAIKERLGLNIDYDYLKKLFAEMNITTARAAEQYLENTIDLELRRWWNIMRYHAEGLNWNKIFGLEGDYYPDAESARRVISKLIPNILTLINCAGKNDVEIYDTIIMQADPRLPPNPVSHYKLPNIDIVLSINRRNLKVN